MKNSTTVVSRAEVLKLKIIFTWRKGRKLTNDQTISFLYLLLLWDGMELNIDDIALFMSGSANLNDPNSWSQLNN